MRSPSILRAMFMVYTNLMKQYSYKFLVLSICLGIIVTDPGLQSVIINCLGMMVTDPDWPRVQVKVQPSASYRYYRTAALPVCSCKCVLEKGVAKARMSYQWRIQDFPQGGAPTPKITIIFQNFAENCMKMKEFGPPGGGRPWRPPLDPPMVTLCRSI